MDRRDVLAELLDRLRAYHAEYRGGLSNHLPMALVALRRMGAPPERLRGYARLYERRLEAAPDEGKALSGSEWRRFLGRKGHYGEFLATFRREIERSGWQAVLRDALPALMPGCAAAAFHPLIRLGYAIEAEAEGEMAIALAYWASRHLALCGGAASDAEPLSDDPEALLARLAADSAFAHRPDEDALIDAEMKKATAAGDFAPVAGWLAISSDTPRRLARAALKIYAGTGDFTALHMVTGVHAARVVLPWCEDRELALRCLWQALAAAYLSIGKPPVPEAPMADAPEAPAWPTLLARVRELADEHAIKLVYSCWVEDQAYGDPLYRTVADSVVRSQVSEVR
jgi:questin oxidase-like protein